MLSSSEPPLRQDIGDGLIMRTTADRADLERVAKGGGLIHGVGVEAMVRNLFLHHPNTSGRDLIFVEDTASGEVASSLCVIPWSLHYEGVALPAGEMGCVWTLPAYRRRGLVRRQVEFFNQRLRERGCLLSHIQGIPYYYRQFGYEYALPLEGGLRLTLREAPTIEVSGFTFRAAGKDDLPTLMRLYDEAAQDLAIHTVRDEAIWHYLLTRTADSDMECADWLIEDSKGTAVGYFRLPKLHFGDELMVSEVSRLSHDAALATLDHLRMLAERAGAPGIRLNVPATCALTRAARPFTMHDGSTYSWQIMVPDMTALLRALAPVLERRIATSAFAGLTQDVEICLYRETIALRFHEGRLEVANLGFQERGPIAFPPLQFVPLLLGQRSWDEQKRAYPDVYVAPSHRLLVETLFPKLSAFLYTVY